MVAYALEVVYYMVEMPGVLGLGLGEIQRIGPGEGVGYLFVQIIEVRLIFPETIRNGRKYPERLICFSIQSAESELNKHYS